MEAAREYDRPSTITRGFLEQLSLEQILAINDFVEKLLEAQERRGCLTPPGVTAEIAEVEQYNLRPFPYYQG